MDQSRRAVAYNRDRRSRALPQLPKINTSPQSSEQVSVDYYIINYIFIIRSLPFIMSPEAFGNYVRERARGDTRLIQGNTQDGKYRLAVALGRLTGEGVRPVYRVWVADTDPVDSTIHEDNFAFDDMRLPQPRAPYTIRFPLEAGAIEVELSWRKGYPKTTSGTVNGSPVSPKRLLSKRRSI